MSNKEKSIELHGRVDSETQTQILRNLGVERRIEHREKMRDFYLGLRKVPHLRRVVSM